jgi:hypothetical protein
MASGHLLMTLFGDGNRRELENLAKAEGRLSPRINAHPEVARCFTIAATPHLDPAKWDFKIECCGQLS